MNSFSKNEKKFFSLSSYGVIQNFISHYEATIHIDKHTLAEVSDFFLRDITRIDKQQRGSVSIAKWAGYWAFWLRKLKPITVTERPESSNLSKEDAVNINEIVAIQFAFEVVSQFRMSSQLQDHVSRKCKKHKRGACDGLSCFKNHVNKYVNFEDEFYYNYIIYSLRNRTFGPHHFALLLENIIYASCDET